ncbi:tetratricopeptide repeat protein [Alcanivorax sp. JB21]|nr:tetratricopeptide repeat protein [Alcanivorax limicola]
MRFTLCTNRLITAALPVLLLAALLGGCASRTPAPPPAEVTKPPAAPRATAPYDTTVIADLMLAELAAQRRQLDVSLAYYTQTARRTRSPEVAGQAARLAAYMEDPALALEMSEHWLTMAPDDTTAMEIAALSHVSLGNADAAAGYIDKLLATNPEAALVRLVTQARNLDQAGNTQLLAALAQLTERYPDQAALWYARALHLKLEEQLEAALDANDEALRRQPRHEDALLLKGRLLAELGRPDEARRHMRRLVRQYPETRRVRVLYVRLLLEAGDEEEAFRQLETLSQQHPDDQDLRLSLALYGMEHGARARAIGVLQQLVEEGYREDEIHGYLAQAAETDGETEIAIGHYLAIRAPDMALRARVQAARLYQKTGDTANRQALMADLRDHYPAQLPLLYAAEAEMLTEENPEAALQLLDEGLHELPDSIELLYARALASERLDKLDRTEADLRRILTLRPDDPDALNALGYTLTDRTERHEEALGYIERALEQRPDNPAIMDSMGWVLFNLGRPEEALIYLEQAYTLYPDDEIAAHLGEVLWSLGYEAEARRIWADSLQREPEGRHVPRVMERLLENDA